MKSDEGFSDMLDKTILIQYQYENVIPFTKKNHKNFRTKVSGVFYFSSGGSSNLSGSTLPILDLNDKTTFLSPSCISIRIFS